MPPKRKRGVSAAKLKTKNDKASNGGEKSGRILRPKTQTNFKAMNDGKGAAKSRTKVKKQPEKVAAKDQDAVSLTPNSSDDDFDGDGEGTSNGESNQTNSAQPVSDDSDRGDDLEDPEADSDHREGDNSGLTAKQVKKMVSKCMKKMTKRKIHKKKSKRRRRDSPSSSEDASDSSDDSSECESDSYSSDDSDSSARGRKRKRRGHKRRKSERKHRRRGKSVVPLTQDRRVVAADSPSQSTVYTRGCKSPVRDVLTASSPSDSQKSGHINSDADTDEVIDSLNTSLNHSSPFIGRRRERGREGGASPIEDHGRNSMERDAQGDEERRRREDNARERADVVVRDIQQNKADLAKPSGELSRELKSLLIDFKHCHLTSHVDRKIKSSILEGDFTIDFRRLVPRSRSRSKLDDRLQMINKDGISCFVPADKDNYKEIASYKQWEVAFKVFMGIYITKWPEHSNELLQYSHIIQTAALTYPWESVYNYDIAFRDIKTDHSDRMWSMICQHTWSLEIGEPSSKLAFQGASLGANNSGTTRGQTRKVCWRFNKGKCVFGAACEFDHRCSVCGGRSHGRSTCYRRGGGERTRDRKEVKKERNDK